MSTMTTLTILFAVMCATLLDAQTPAKGGYRDMDVNEPEAQKAGRLAAAHLEREKDSFRTYRLERLISAQKQVVQGTNYRLELIIARTNCYRGQKVNLENCRAVKVQTCNATIYVPLQSQSSELSSGSCVRETAVDYRTTIRPTTRRPCLGCVEDIDVTDDGVIKAASFATQQLTSKSNGQYRVESKRIIKATFQVVSGYSYRLIMEVSLTGSGNSEIKSTECEVKVWDQAWRSPRYILSEYNCDEFID